ncbi:hypothetical protein Dda_6803 [Drechslerella dactyloides]|uniref:CorA-like transporter domain-containing protein n=1 Tax=Drechslerella dactyloides TaxID=74499 RepID=A0AAD6IW98_DREDA|nr:hypothetical protein Dda_6803 [Drechslerella dactyloides]
MSAFGDGWEAYPTRSAENVPLGCDTEQIRLDISEPKEQKRLFANQDNFNLWFANNLSIARAAETSQGRDCVEKHEVRNTAILSELWLGDEKPHGTAFYMIPQENSNSWKELSATASTFRRVLTFHGVFPPFFKIVHSYGKRCKPDGDTYHAFSRNISADSQDYEICYNLRFFEPNKRGSCGGWSERQTGVYHKYNRATGKSIWIFLRPSDSMKRMLEDTLRYDCAKYFIDTKAVLIYHASFISCALRCWKEYLAYLESKLLPAEEIAGFSDVDKKNVDDYPLQFSTCQDLEQLRCKLLKVDALLESIVNIIDGVKVHSERLKYNTPTDPSDTERLTSALDGYLSEITYHKSRVRSLLERCTGTGRLLSGILEHRNLQLVCEATESSQRTLQAMKRLAYEQEIENKIGQKNAVTGKALTMMATLYLPVSLIASVFSSNLVGTQDDGGGNFSDSYFVIAPDFWKFVVVVIPLTVATFILVFSMEWFMLWTTRKKRVRSLSEKGAERDEENGGSDSMV